MITTSTIFNERIKSSSRTFRARFKLVQSVGEPEGWPVLDCEVKKVVIRKGACAERFSPGTVFVPYINAEISNTSVSIENEELLLQIGLLLDDGTIEYTNQGYYTVINPNRSASQISFEAVGRISSKLNELPELPAEQSLENLTNAITTKTGVTIITNGVTLSGIITTDLNGLTCREILEVITSVLGGFATEDGDGNIVISKYSTADYLEFNGDYTISPPTFNEYNYALSGIKVVVKEEYTDENGNVVAETAYTDGVPTMTISNIYMTEALFSAYVKNTVGYSFKPGDIVLALGDPRIEPFDSILFTDIDGSNHIVPCLELTHTFDGGLTTSISAKGESETESSFIVKGPVQKQLERLSADLFTAKDAILKRMLADSIITDDITAVTGSFTKYLTGVNIIGDLIKANTLKADALILQGTDGIYRRLNIDALGQTTVDSDPIYNEKLDGSVLVAKSVTADQINVTDLFARYLEATDLHILGKSTFDGQLIANAGSKIGGFTIDPEGLKMENDNIYAEYDFKNNPWSSKINIVSAEGYPAIGLLTNFIDAELLESYTVSAQQPSINWNMPSFKAAIEDKYYMTDITKATLKLVLVYSNDGNTINGTSSYITIESDDVSKAINTNYKYVAFGFVIIATGNRIYIPNPSAVMVGDYAIDFFSDSYNNIDMTYTSIITTYKPKLTIKSNGTGAASITPIMFRYGAFVVNRLGEVLIDDEELETLWAEHMK